MKKLLLLLALLSVQISFAQDQANERKKGTTGDKGDPSKKEVPPTLEAIYDFETQKYTTYPLKPKHKQPVVLKITNINKIANSVEITSNDIKIKDDFLDSDEKTIAKILDTDKKAEEIKPSEAKVDLSIPKTALSDAPNRNLKSEEIKRLNTEIEAHGRTISSLSIELEHKQDSIKQYEKKLNDTEAIPKNELAEDLKKQYQEEERVLKENIAEIKQRVITTKQKLNTASKELVKTEVALNEKNGALKNLKAKASDLVDKYAKLKANIKDINRINSAYNSYIDYIINPNLTHNHYEKDSRDMCVILKQEQRNDYYRYITSFDKDYNEFIEYYYKLKNDDLFYEVKDFNESYANLVMLQIENLKKDVDDLYKIANLNELRKKLNNVEIIHNVLSKEKSFSVVSNPIQPLEDYLEFKVKIKQNKELGTSIIKEMDKDFTYMEYVRHGVRWDVSLGTVFDFGIKNQEYEIRKNADNYEIIENNTSNYTPTIAGILHTSFRSDTMFAFGLSLGLSINITELNFNSFFPGVSLLIGKREKMVFTVGPAFKKVNQIKGIYKDNRVLDEEIQVTDITNEKFKIGYFFGITYNLTSSQKSKIKDLK